MDVKSRFLARRAMKEAVRKTTVLSSDTERAILGKLFNHFKQSLRWYGKDGWQVIDGAVVAPKRMKDFRSSYKEDVKYIGDLLSNALLEVQSKHFDTENVNMLNALNSMKVILNEAKKVNDRSETVLNKLSDIERNISNV